MKKEFKKETVNVVKPATFVGGRFWVEVKGKRYKDFCSIRHGSGFTSVGGHTDYPGSSYEFEYIDLETAFTHNEFDDMNDGFVLYLGFEEFDGAVEDECAKKLPLREESYYISHVHSFVKEMDQMGVGSVVYRFILEDGLSTYGKCISHVGSEFGDEVKYKE